MLDEFRLRLSRGVVDPRLVVRLGIVKGVEGEHVQGNSIDLSVREVFKTEGSLALRKSGERELPEFIPEPLIVNRKGLKCFRLLPGNVYQVEFEQTIDLPHFLCGVTLIRSTLGKSGCSGENGLYDSGYSGSMGMMVTVLNTAFIEQGATVAQVMLFRSHSKGNSYQGFYQNTKGPSEWTKNGTKV